MRTLGQILIDAQDGNIPDHEECYYAMLALNSKLSFMNRALLDIAKAYEEGKITEKGITIALRASSQNRLYSEMITFKKQSPKDWLGITGNPLTKEGRRLKNIADKILEKVTKKKK